jgi:hypothetical protein
MSRDFFQKLYILGKMHTILAIVWCHLNIDYHTQQIKTQQPMIEGRKWCAHKKIYTYFTKIDIKPILDYYPTNPFHSDARQIIQNELTVANNLGVKFVFPVQGQQVCV